MVTRRFGLSARLAALVGALVHPLQADIPVSEARIPSMPAEWRTRVLRNPPGYEKLEPSDIIVGFWPGRKNNFDDPGQISLSQPRMAPGSTVREGNIAWDQVFPMAEIPQTWGFLGSQTLGKVSIGWVAWVRVARFGVVGRGRPLEGGGFAYGAASLPEALEEAASQAIAGFRRAGGTRIDSLRFEAGVATKADYELSKRNGTFTNTSALPFCVTARFRNLRRRRRTSVISRRSRRT